MQTASSSNSELPRDLPPVVPPSGKFLAQLFLVPGLIVAAAIFLLLGFNWLAGGARAPDRLLANLKQANPDVRWRAANDLAQVLLRDEQLASNPKFCLDLTEQAQYLADESRLVELNRSRSKAPRDVAAGEEPTVIQALQVQRNTVDYFCACLGNLTLPVGVPLLGQIATLDDSLPEQVGASRRQKAIWALANLGKNVQRFDKLPDARRREILQDLNQESQSGNVQRAELARAAFTYLSAPAPRSLAVPGVLRILESSSKDTDPFTRELTALALNHWEGTTAENATIDELLLRLTRDDGRGGSRGARGDRDAEQGDESFTRIPGLEVRYNAAIALARRASPKSRLDLLQEMLDEGQQRESFRVRKRTGVEVEDEATVRLILIQALQAIVELHKREPGRSLESLVAPIQKLSQSSIPIIRVEAEKALIELSAKK